MTGEKCRIEGREKNAEERKGGDFFFGRAGGGAKFPPLADKNINSAHTIAMALKYTTLIR